MNRLHASLAHSLLAKNASFCLYRLPLEKESCIALDKKFLSLSEHRNFWIAPFTSTSSAPEIFFSCVDEVSELEAIIHHIQSLPDRPVNWPELPEQISHEDYMHRAEVYLKGIHEGRLQKAILSRVKKVIKPDDFDPVLFFENLCEKYPQAFIHLLFHTEGGMWMGATPELLLKMEDDQITTMALASTQPANDQHEYNWGTKEMEEHLMVGQHIESVFANQQYILNLKDGPHTVEAGPVAHLRTAYSFSRKDSTNLTKLLNELHPTPAVGGLPAKEAVDFILNNEGYDRQYYCGFLGETDFEKEARLFINLRCMQIGREEIAIYCGGGITADSDPESEWEETVQKSRTMLGILKEFNRNEVVR